MRPKLFTLRNLILLLMALAIFGGLAYWGSKGFPLPFGGVPSTAGKIAFGSDRDGQPELYLVDTTTKEITRLTNSEAREAELAFSADGQHLTFTSNIGGTVRQVCLTEAAPDRKLVALTRTQSTKELPGFFGEDHLYFLDSGKVARIRTDASDADAIFPTVEGKHENKALGSLFTEGGVTRYTVSPDGESVVAAIRRDRCEVLAIYEHDTETLVLLGFAQKLHFQYRDDGTLVALFQAGGPLKQPMQIAVPKNEEEGAMIASQLEQLLGELGGQAEALEGQSVLVHFDAQFAPSGALPIPFVVDDFAMAPDGKTVAIFSSSDAAKANWGIFVGSFASQEPLQRLVDKPVEALTWSPDSTQFAYISEGSLLLSPVSGSDSPINLSQGKGTAYAPVWSPAKASKK